MRTYTFTGPKPETTVVEASSESEAHRKAMEERWGPPEGLYAPSYAGRGLSLVRSERHDG